MRDKIFAILLAGGFGTRLWPISRERFPKQLVRFTGGDSLIQTTVKRLSPAIDTENVRIVCGAGHVRDIERDLDEIGIRPEGKIVPEPCGRNTAPAILLGVMAILEQETDAIVFVFPADHVISDTDAFHKKIRQAADVAEMGHMVMFGIEPEYPETGYGYVEGGEAISDVALKVRRFVEKPDMETAVKYIEAGNFFWNSGMFAFKASAIAGEFEKFHPEILAGIKEMVSKREITKAGYEQLTNISIDYAIMENTDTGAILPSAFGWSDIGSWKSLYDFLPKDENNNVVHGDAILRDSKNCLVIAQKSLVAANRVNGLAVVETGDSVFVSDLETSRDVQFIVKNLKKEGRREYQSHMTKSRSWGFETVLEEQNDFGIERLAVDPGSRMEMNCANMKAHFFVLKGTLRITAAGETHSLSEGQSVTIFRVDTAELANAGDDVLQLVCVRASE